jgi:hypothetical protein
MANMIRNISQTAQERTIVKTAPDIVVYLDGLPYLINYFIDDPKTGINYTNVPFNDHVTSFSASYDTDLMVPSCSIGLQVPNYVKYLYQQPGGNNVLQTMMQVQVYCKGYYNNTSQSTVYRRVFKGVVSHIGYNDNGKTLEVSIQAYGSLYMLEKMQININPSVQCSTATGSQLTIWQTNFAYSNPYRLIADMFLLGLNSDAFQLNNLQQQAVLAGQFGDAIRRGYIAKWQSVLVNMAKDVHIYGADWKDNLGQASLAKKSDVVGAMDLDIMAAGVNRYSVAKESTDATQMYYANIQTYQPFKIITEAHLFDPVIRNRLDIIREVVQMIDFEAYQDVDGKIIIKPPLYNLDVTNLGTRTNMTSTQTGSNAASQNNPLTQIYQNNNPFVVYLDEILTEQETEDQAAIRRTRTTITGNVMRDFQINYPEKLKPTVEFIDVAKLAKFGLREEPSYNVPWLDADDKISMFAHAASETARMNRGYRTYTITIPLRPELKLGFPMFFPHKDMYGYIKSISINYQVGGAATMTVMCDTLRRRVLISTQQTGSSGYSQLKNYNPYTTAPNLVLQWTKNPNPSTAADPNQSAGYNQQTVQPMTQQLASGGPTPSSSGENVSNEVGSSKSLTPPFTNPDGTKWGPSAQQLIVNTYNQQVIGSTAGNQTDSATNSYTASYVVKNDGNSTQGTMRPDSPATKNAEGQMLPAYHSQNGGFFTQVRGADLSYMQDLMGNPITGTPSTLPYTDDKGYEVVAPFPWGRWQNLNAAIKEFTQQGWALIPTNSNGQPTQDVNEIATLEATDAFMFAGLGTPTASNSPSNNLLAAQATLQSTVGGSFGSTGPTSTTSATGTSASGSGTGNLGTTNLQPDATIIVLDYSTMTGAFSDSSLLNSEQPENSIAQSLITGTETAEQQLVNVLVTGQVSSTKTTQEQLLAQKNNQSPLTLAATPPSVPGS